MLKASLKWLLIFALFGFLLFIWFYYGGHEAALSNHENKFEAISALFSGLAFIGLLCALFLQKKELDETRKELAITAQANRESAEIAKNALKHQLLSKHFSDHKEFIEEIHNEYFSCLERIRIIEEKLMSCSPEKREILMKEMNELHSRFKMANDLNQRILELQAEYTDIMRVVWPEGTAYFGTCPSLNELKKEYQEE